MQDELRQSLSHPENVQIIVASLSDPVSMRALTAQTTVVVSTAGPFDIIGLPVRCCFCIALHFVCCAVLCCDDVMGAVLGWLLEH